MSVYTVQAPIGSLGEPQLERSVFLREGFSWGAFFFGFLWLAFHALWLPAAVWLLACFVLSWFAFLHLSLGSFLVIALALRLLLGLEAHGLLRRKFARRRYRLIDVVTATGREAAERIFFARIAQRDALRPAGQDMPPPPPSPSRGPDDVLGIFPEPETGR